MIKGSILNNLRLGKNDADDSELIDALKMANAEFVLELRDKWHTLVEYDDRGVELTMSQKQRIAMARALLSKPRLILIEELSARLDFKSQAQLNRAINNIIAHARASQNITVVISTY